jgi:hypothetical protein
MKHFLRSSVFLITIILLCFPRVSFSEQEKKAAPATGNIIQEQSKSKNEKKAENTKGLLIPEIKISTDKTKVKTGEIITINLEFKLPEGSTYNLSEDLSGLDGLTLIEKSGSGNKLVLKAIIDKLVSFEIGPVSLSFKDQKGDLNIIKSEKIPVEIISNLGPKPEEAALKPIMDIIPTYPIWLRLLPWIIGIIAIGIIVFIYIYIRKRIKSRNNLLNNVKEPHVIAEEAIRKLLSMDLTGKGAYKEFYFNLSEILRIYIESLRGFPAAELTTEEIIRKIKNETDRKMIPLLRWMDMVKFADTIPSRDRNEQDVKNALDYIKETAPVIVTADSLT